MPEEQIADWRDLGNAPKPTGAHKPGNLNHDNVGEGTGASVRWTNAPSTVDDPLFGATKSGYTIEHEKVWHRRAQELHMQGYNTNDIGAMLGRSPASVKSCLKQDWAVERMNNRMKEDASVQIKTFLEEECLPSLMVLKEIRDNPNCRPADRKSAADSLADRFLGRAAQPIYDATKTAPPTELTNEELSAQVNSIVEGMAATPSDSNKS